MISASQANLLQLLLNLTFIALAYKTQISHYKNEEEYKGNLTVVIRYFHTIQEMANNSQEGRRELIKGMSTMVIPAVMWLLFSSYLSAISSEKISVLGIISNVIVVLMVAFPIYVISLMFWKNQIYPENGIIAKKIRKSVGDDISGHLRKRILESFDEQADKDNYPTIVNKELHKLVDTNWSNRDEVYALVKNLQTLPNWEDIEEKGRYSWVLFSNEASEMMNYMADDWDSKSDEEKHKEYLSSKRSSTVTFWILTAFIMLPLILKMF